MKKRQTVRQTGRQTDSGRSPESMYPIKTKIDQRKMTNGYRTRDERRGDAD